VVLGQEISEFLRTSPCPSGTRNQERHGALSQAGLRPLGLAPSPPLVEVTGLEIPSGLLAPCSANRPRQPAARAQPLVVVPCKRMRSQTPRPVTNLAAGPWVERWRSGERFRRCEARTAAIELTAGGVLQQTGFSIRRTNARRESTREGPPRSGR